MNSSDPVTISLTTPTNQYSIAPGGSLKLPVIITNQGRAPNHVRLSVEGIPLVWVSAEQQVVLLQPGQQAEVSLTIQPPAPPQMRIGRYNLILRATSVVDPTHTVQAEVVLTVAGFEVKGRVGVLMRGLQYSVVPGEQLEIPVMLINQGLGADTFRLTVDGLPDSWINIPTPASPLEPGEVVEAVLIVKPPRDPSSRASRYPFQILVASQGAPKQGVSIDCALTVAAFTEFKSSLEAAQPDQNLLAKVWIHNLSNIPATFRVNWSSPNESLTFEPNEPQPINVPSGEMVNLEYTVQPARRPFFGGEKSYPYSVNVQASDQQTQTLDSSLVVKGLLPTWALVALVVVLVLLCLYAVWSLRPGSAQNPAPITATMTLTSTVKAPMPTATQSQIDQRPLLIERNWYLVAYNNTRSSPGVQEAFNLFNPDGTLIGYTGCKDFSSSYQTNHNQISISNINLGPGVCSDAALQQQEDALVAILRSARSYFVADTALQIAGDAGFLNYSLTPVYRPEDVLPPQAVIRAVPQAEVEQVVVFDGGASTGQVPLVTWGWDFGDGGIASGVVVQHTYRYPGTYNVRLTVTDQRGQTGTTTQQIHILALPTPTLQPTMPPPTSTTEPTQLPPTAPAEQPTPTIPPEPPTSTPEPLPEPIPPQANILGPSQGFIGEPVTFDASASQPGSGSIVSYSWSFGNGTDMPASPVSKISTIYNRAGNYEVTVFVHDADGLSSQATTRININARLDTDVWTLATINNKALLPGTAITLQFLQGGLVGFAGCNTYIGEYTAFDNGDGTYTVATGKLTTSRLSCPQDIIDQENKYMEVLQQATLATIQENMITLHSQIGSLVFYLIEAR